MWGDPLKKRLSFLKELIVEFSTHPLRGGSPICINPFSSIPIQDSEAASDALAMLKPILSLMAAPKEGTTDIEDTYLEQAIQEAWHERRKIRRPLRMLGKLLLNILIPLPKLSGNGFILIQTRELMDDSLMAQQILIFQML